ncbi:hypothetical protein B0H17DRAFT_1149353 [Mycena rosella]|uniref:Uncharacterized protein n=1 Tax=Mycena rosella TaxID=1033263 RepID=A0AAD7FTT8_MYCRO|nr:hypothetical protein B0H17DRAFT_1149353 [Mycena rosella]
MSPQAGHKHLATVMGHSFRGYSWDADVYVGLRKFHGAKGFDPCSQDVARHLDCPLYQLSGELQVPLAHVNIPVAELEVDRPATIDDEQPDRPSRCCQVLMFAKAMLILFLLVCSLDKFLRKGQLKPGGR